LVGPFSRWTHVQLSVVAMGFLAYLIWGATYSQSTARAEMAAQAS